ncbi:MAG: GIY-YIG nuclease family protein [Cytophagaceae bacterium]
MYFIYILYSPSFDKYYVGYTHDYSQRLISHNTTDRNTFTSKYRPWEIKALFQVGDVEAKPVRIEKFIKRQKSKAFLIRLIEGCELFGELAQLIRVPHARD